MFKWYYYDFLKFSIPYDFQKISIAAPSRYKAVHVLSEHVIWQKYIFQEVSEVGITWCDTRGNYNIVIIDIIGIP